MGRVGSLLPERHCLKNVSDIPDLRANERTLSSPTTCLSRDTNASRSVSGNCDDGVGESVLATVNANEP